jgi:hypothetical protein
VRNLVENTNAAAQRVDTQYKNVGGSTYIGMEAGGKGILDSRGATPDFALQSGGTDIIAYNSVTGNVVLNPNGGNVGIGSVPTNVFDVAKNYNGASIIGITNGTAGVASSARVILTGTGGAGQIIQFGGSYTTSGVLRQDGMALYANGAGGLTFNTAVNQPIYFAVNNTQVMQHDANRLTLSKPVQLPISTVALLPAGQKGDVAYVTDALAPAYNTAVAGGGAVNIKVCHNGTNWMT